MYSIFEDSIPFHMWYESQTDLTAITDPVLFQDTPVQGNCNNGGQDGYTVHALYMYTVHVIAQLLYTLCMYMYMQVKIFITRKKLDMTKYSCNSLQVDYRMVGNGIEPFYDFIYMY